MLAVKSPLGQRGLYRGVSHGNVVTFTIRARPLPEAITSFLKRNVVVIRRLSRDVTASTSSSSSSSEEEIEEARTDNADSDNVLNDGQRAVAPDDFWPALQRILKDSSSEWNGWNEDDLVGRVCAFGPRMKALFFG